jgi:hypothetical protein
MTYYYAQINAESICFSVSQLAGPIFGPSIIAIDSYNMDLLGKRWTGTTWEDVPPPPEPPVE